MPIHPDTEPGSYTKKFRLMLAMISAPGGGQWGPTKMKRATNGRIGLSYFNSLRDGHVDIPRADKIEAIAEAMNFPPELWFKNVNWWEALYEAWKSGEDIFRLLAKDDEALVGTKARRKRKAPAPAELDALMDPDVREIMQNYQRVDEDKKATLRGYAKYLQWQQNEKHYSPG